MQNQLTLFANSAAGSMQSEHLHTLWHKQVPISCRGEAFFIEPENSFKSTLQRALADCERRNSTLLVAGGDGTVSSVVNAIAGSNRAFAVLPQGTFNFFARSRGIPLDPAVALQFALSAEAVTIPLAYLNDRAFIVNVGLGLYPKVIAAREAHQKITGRSNISAIASGVWTMLSERQLSRARLQYNELDQQLLTPLLMISHNRQQLEDLDPRFLTETDRLTVLRMRPVAALGLLRLLANGLSGRLLDEDNMDCFNVDELKVQMRGSSVRVAIDGELIKMPLPLHFSVRRESIRCLLNGETS